MHVLDGTVTIRLSRGELWMLATGLQHAIMDSIEEHYNCLQQAKDGETLFFEQKKDSLELMKELYALYGGHSTHYDSVIQQAKRLFQEKREERAAAAKGLAAKPEHS